jgi:hypothetical protein
LSALLLDGVAVRRVFAVALCACAPAGGGSASDVEITTFVEDVLISGKVLQNSTACEVDAACYLRIEFADTSIVALYGTGERPALACEISRDVSDRAFQTPAGQMIAVVISQCGSDGYYLRQLDLGPD